MATLKQQLRRLFFAPLSPRRRLQFESLEGRAMLALLSAGDQVFVTMAGSGTVGGVSFQDEDILVNDAGGSGWAMFFDGSDLGLKSVNVDAFQVRDDNTILLSFNKSTRLPGVAGTVQKADIVKFTPTSLGDNTAGSFEWYVDGSDIGLKNSADIDAIDETPDGRLVISLGTNTKVKGVQVNEEDLLVLNGGTFGPHTTGTLAFYMDGSDVGLQSGKEDVWGVSIDPSNGDIYLNTAGKFSVPGLSGDNNDIFRFQPTSLGPSTAGSYSAAWDGAAHGLGTKKVDGISLRLNQPPQVTGIEGAVLVYTENDPPTEITNTITVSDPDDPNLVGATIQISVNYANGQDLLDIAGALPTGITSAGFNAATGTLTLTGSAPVASYQQALRQITYQNTSDNPSTAPRAVSFTVNDGTGNSAPQTRGISVVAVNDAPVLAGIESSPLNYTENDPPTPISNSITLADVDDANIESAVVQVTSNYAGSEDVLSVVGTLPLGIVANFNSATGTLTLTGSASKANYETALRQIGYSNTSDNPSTATRSVTFTINDGDTNSNTQTRDINVAVANDAPTLANIESAPLAYTENSAAVPITSTLTVADSDDTNLEGASISISANFQSGDVLAFVDQLGITGNFNSGTGVLTLTGTASVASYQTALRSITFQSTNDNPSATKTVSFQVGDGDASSNIATRDISITAVNDAPVVDTTNAALTYAENSGPVAADPGLTVTDVDSTQIQSATVQITSNFVSAQDDLAFTNQLGITGVYNDATGTLTLTGSASVSDYQAALRAVTYENNSDNPSTATRTLTFQVTDAQGDASAPATRDINTTAANDAPVLANIETANLTYTENDPATQITASLTVADADDTNLEGATVSINVNFQSGDDLIFVNQFGISGVYNTGTGVLTLTGTASVADYQTALRSITFRAVGDNPSTLQRTVTFTVNDGDVNSNPQSRNINVVAVNDAPTLTLDANNSGGSAPGFSSTFNTTVGTPTNITDADLDVTDPDNTTLASATITITNIQDAGNEVLAATPSGAILAGDIIFAAGVLTITRVASLADYEAVLASVTYDNTAATPTLAPDRQVTFVVNDGTANSTTVIAVVDLVAGPVIDLDSNNSSGAAGNHYSTAFVEANGGAGTGPVAIADGDTTIISPAGNIQQATIVLTTNPDGASEFLTVMNANGLTVSGNNTASITLSGSATPADYETAIESILYSNNSNTPTTTSRTVQVVVQDVNSANSAAAITTIAITSANDAPTANNDAASVGEDVLTLTTVANVITGVGGGTADTDPDGPSLTVTAVQGGTVGTTFNVMSAGGRSLSVNLASNGTLQVNPSGNFEALDNVNAPLTDTVTFTYTISDGSASSTATIVVTVNGANDAPNAVDDLITSINEDAGATDITAAVTSNDTDADAGDTKTITAKTDPAKGIVTLAAGVLSFNPNGQFNSLGAGQTEDVTFTYTLSDGTATDTATVTVRVQGVNDAPTDPNESFSVQSNVGINVPTASGLLAGASDPEGTTVTMAGGSVGTFATTQGGSITIAADGSFTYTPQAGDRSIADTFVYTVTDGTDTDTSTVTFNIDANTIWFVNFVALTNGTGTVSSPFNALAPLDNGGPDSNGDTIFVYTSDSSTATHTLADDFDLQASQLFIGEGVTTGNAADTINTLRSFTTHTHSLTLPTVNASNHVIASLNVDAVTLNSGNTLRGFDIGNTGTGTGLVGSSIGTLSIDDIAIAAVARTGQIMNLATGTLQGLTGGSAATFSSLNGTGGSTGLVLNGVAGQMNVTGATAFVGTGGAKGIEITMTGAATLTTNFQGGLDIDTVNERGLHLTGPASATLNFNVTATGGNETITSTAGQAIDATEVNFAAAFDSVTSGGGTNGISLTEVTGSLTIEAGALSGASGATFNVIGGTADVTFQGSITKTSAGQLINIDNHESGLLTFQTGALSATGSSSGIAVQNKNSGTVSFNSSSKTLNTGSNAAVNLVNNTGATINFAGGGLDIDTTSGTGFSATGGGTLIVFGSGNSITSTTGTALNIVNTTIGASGLNFESISANGASSGIVLNNTGGSAGLTVTGTGTAGTGGTIQNTTSNGVFLSQTINPSLSFMNINDSGDNGIFVDAVSGLNLANLFMDSNGAQAEGGAIHDAGIHIEDLIGVSNTISNSTIQDSRNTNLDWDPNSSSSMSTLTVTNTNLNHAGEGVVGQGNAGINLVATGSANVKLVVSGGQIKNNAAAGILATGSSGTTVRTDIDSVDMVSSAPPVDLTGATWGNGVGTNFGISLSSTGTSVQRHRINNVQLAYTGIAPNDGGAASAIGFLPAGTGTFDITITNNTIGLVGAPRSGNENFFGIAGDIQDSGTYKVNISNNTIRNTAFNGIFIQTRDPSAVAGNSTTDLTLRNNIVGSISDDDDFPAGAGPNQAETHAIRIESRNDSVLRVDIANNSADGLGANQDYLVRQRDTSTFALERLSSNTNVAATVELFIIGQDPSPAGQTARATVATTYTAIADGTVQDPALPLLFVASAGDTTQPVEGGILTSADLGALVTAAIERWAATGLSGAQIELLESVVFVVADLPAGYLGAAGDGTITLDLDAAGNAWFIDPTPLDDSEFAGPGTQLFATAGGAAGRVDALTTVLHELGHQLGLEDTYAAADQASLMYGYLTMGQRRLPALGQALGTTPHVHSHDHDHENEVESAPAVPVTPITHDILTAAALAELLWSARTESQPTTHLQSAQVSAEEPVANDILSYDQAVMNRAASDLQPEEQVSLDELFSESVDLVDTELSSLVSLLASDQDA